MAIRFLQATTVVVSYLCWNRTVYRCWTSTAPASIALTVAAAEMNPKCGQILNPARQRALG